MNHIYKYQNSTKTISVCSGKGGVGKSVLAANIALSLSELGSEVTILDSVLDLPNQHILFGVEPPVRLSSVMSGKVETEVALFKVAERTNLLVDSPVEFDEFNDVSSSLLDVVNYIKSMNEFDYLIIDTQSGISDNNLGLCLQSDMIIIVITDEPTSLLDAYGLLKILINYIDHSKIFILVNNVIDSDDAIDVSQKLNLATSRFLNVELKVLGFVPYSRNVRLSIQRQELLVKNYPDDESSVSIKTISKKIHSKYFESSYINNEYEMDVEVNI